jgi:ABC-type glutathione transport system ATPase component
MSDHLARGVPSAPNNDGPLLRVCDLRVEFSSSSGRVHAVNGVSFDVEAH